MFDLVVIGHLLNEKIVFDDGRTIGPLLGGPAGYASVAAARLGLKVGLVTTIGRAMPAGLLEVFAAAGVDTQGIRRSQATTTNRLVYDRAGNKRLEFLEKADDIRLEQMPPDYLAARFFLVAPVDYEVPENMIRSLHQRGKRLSMELSGFGGASSAKPARFSKTQRLDFLKAITPCFEVVKGGQEDCQALRDDTCHPTLEIVHEMAGHFTAWGAKLAVMTLGEAGAFVMSHERSFQTPACSAAVVDCTGAGDVWHAGFLAAYLENDHLEHAAAFASATASLVIERSGGIRADRFPDREQVRRRVNQCVN